MRRILIAIAAAVVLVVGFGASEAAAQGWGSDDPLLVTPEVFIVIDTSGSMRVGTYQSGGCAEAPVASCSNEACVMNGRWCSPRCCAGCYYCDGYGGAVTCLRNRIETVREVLTGDYNTCQVGQCCDQQTQNGILDMYSDLIRFGFATFDNDGYQWGYGPWWINYDRIGCAPGSTGWYPCWCEWRGWALHQMGLKGRTDGSGKLIDLVLPTDPDDILGNNQRVQDEACAMFAIGGTPISAALLDTQEYMNNWRTEIDPPYIDNVAHCRPKFVILMSDGQQSPGNPYDLFGTPESQAAAVCAMGIPVIVVGFGDPGLEGPLTTIAWEGSGPSCSAARLAPFMAENPEELREQFTLIFDAILTGTASRTESVSTPVDLTTDTSYMYGAYFRISESGAGWKGYLVRQKIETGGGGTWQWSTDNDTCDGDAQLCFHKELFERSWSSRKIYTVAHDPRSQECVADSNCFLPRDLHTSDPQVGLFPFSEAANSGSVLTSNMCMQDDAYANEMINYALGDPSLTGQAGPVLGDIFHSSPVVVSPPSALTPNFRYEAHFRANMDRYTMVYVGANDGMLHAFVAEDNKDGDGGDHEGEELWGFIPNNLLPKIQKIRSGHSFFVDGTPVVKDVFLNDAPLMDPANPSQPIYIDGEVVKGSYRSILIGGQRGGGGAYYALDVTDPENPKYMWEYRTGVSPVRDYADIQCTGGEGIQTWAEPIIGQVWVKRVNPPAGEPVYVGRSVAIVPGGYISPKSLNNVRSCIEFVEGLVSASSLHVIDIETGKLLRRFSFASGADADILAKLEAYYEQLASDPTSKWKETFQSDDYHGPGGWAWGNSNPGTDGWICSEDRHEIQNPPQFPPELMETCVVVQDDADVYEMHCCWKLNQPDLDPKDCNPNEVGSCYYSYLKLKNVPGGVVIKLKGVNCKEILENQKSMFLLNVGEDFVLESSSATPAAYNTSLGEYITRVFLPTTKGIVYRVDLTHAEYDQDADEGEMIASYTDADGNVHDWTVSKWWPKPPDDDLGRPIQVTPTLGMSYERDLVLFFGTGVIDSLEWTDSQDYLYAVKEERTLDAATGYYNINETGEWFVDEARSKFTDFNTSERLFSQPLLVGGKIFFTTYKPNADECLPGDAKIYGMYFDNMYDDIIFEEEKTMSSTPSSPAMLWTPTGPEVVVQRATRVEKLGLTNPIEPAAHVVHWGKVL